MIKFYGTPTTVLRDAEQELNLDTIAVMSEEFITEPISFFEDEDISDEYDFSFDVDERVFVIDSFDPIKYAKYVEGRKEIEEELLRTIADAKDKKWRQLRKLRYEYNFGGVSRECSVVDEDVIIDDEEWA